MKRVLIITYYWPPSGGSGVQRWLKFAKYLPEFGWQPVIYCPENPDYTVLDESLKKDVPKEAEIIQGPIFEPYRFFRKITGQKEVIGTGLTSSNTSKKSSGLLKNFMIWVRGNVFIPDARMFWIRPSIKRLRKYLVEHPVDAIVTTGPPHSCHLIGLGLKRHFPNIKWIADFRDPWTTIDFYKDLKIGSNADKKHHRLENKVVEYSDELIVVTPGMKDEFEDRFRIQKTHFIANGFDSEDYDDIRNDLSLTDSKKLTIAHIGTIPPARNPLVLWDALKQIQQEQPDTLNKFDIHLIGNVDNGIKTSLQETSINHLIRFTPYIPHKDIPKAQASADILLLIINNSPNAKQILTGKLFEYLASNKPIIAIGPHDSDSAKVLRETGAGVLFDYDDIIGLKKVLITFTQNKLTLQRNEQTIGQYDRKYLTKKLHEVIDTDQVL